ncbi:MAG: flagellar biosynthetic protein FliO, partial [Planctomycetota bacterium]
RPCEPQNAHSGVSARDLHIQNGHSRYVATMLPRSNDGLSVYLPVAGFERRLMFLLVTAAWLGGVCVVCPAQPAADEPESEQANPERNESDLGGQARTDSLFANDPDFAGKEGYEPGGREFFVRTMLAVVFVIVLGVAAIYVSKRLLPKITNLPGKEIRIVETAYLGPRKAVHLIEVGKRRFLVGSTNENIRKLAEVTAGFPNLSEHDIDFG